MISLVTLSHRVSNIHKRYARIHFLVFSFSLTQLKYIFWKENEPDYCKYQPELDQIGQELAAVRSIINGAEELQPGTTIGREYALALDVYIEAFSETVEWLSIICRHRCKDRNGVEPYSTKQDWIDRAEYDKSVQQYKRLGLQLHHLFKRL